MFSSIVPLYDASVWIIQFLFNDVILDALVRNVPSIHAFGEAFAGLCKHLAFEIPPYITAMASTCDYAKDGDLCYEPGNNRVIDLITVMASVRIMAASITKIVLSVCASGAAGADILMFPLMDINLAKGLHNIFNVIFNTVFQLPAVTALRCVNHCIDPRTKGFKPAGGSILMCLPDFNAPINMLVAGIRNLGVLGDNWLDVSSIIAQRSLGLLDDQLDCKSRPSH